MSGDAQVLDALERAAQYHAGCTYPDGSSVETIDGRNPYHQGVHLGNAGFCHTAAGRGFLAQQHAIYLQSTQQFDADYAAQILLYGAGGPALATAAGQDRYVYLMGNHAKMVRQRPWFWALSAFTGSPPQNRWGQDRQNFVSIFHDQIGLIVGGGNPKLGEVLQTTSGDAMSLGESPFAWTVPQPGGDIEHNGWRLSLPPNARVVWPVLPHNPYRKDGAATIEEARLVMALPFTKTTMAHELRLFVI
jgi:hypothetical protein